MGYSKIESSMISCWKDKNMNSSDQLKAMKCKFVFSASPIMNGTKIGLKYLNIFSDKDSHYFIYLYEVV